jgi:hypothetical protein
MLALLWSDCYEMIHAGDKVVHPLTWALIIWSTMIALVVVTSSYALVVVTWKLIGCQHLSLLIIRLEDVMVKKPW